MASESHAPGTASEGIPETTANPGDSVLPESFPTEAALAATQHLAVDVSSDDLTHDHSDVADTVRPCHCHRNMKKLILHMVNRCKGNGHV